MGKRLGNVSDQLLVVVIGRHLAMYKTWRLISCISAPRYSASLSYPLSDIPEKEEVIELFSRNYLSCLASGSVNHLFKFFFYGEMVRCRAANYLLPP